MTHAVNAEIAPGKDTPDSATCAAQLYCYQSCPPGEKQFDHPFVQAFVMFVGEFMCLVVFKIMVTRARHKNEVLFQPRFPLGPSSVLLICGRALHMAPPVKQQHQILPL